MTKGDIQERIDSAADSFIQDLRSLIQAAAHEAVQRALTGGVDIDLPETSLGSPSSRSSRGRRTAGRQATPGARRAKRSRKEVEKLTDQLLEYIEKNPGQRMEEISAGLDVPSYELTLPMRHLVRENHLRTEGHKRATTYYAR